MVYTGEDAQRLKKSCESVVIKSADIEETVKTIEKQQFVGDIPKRRLHRIKPKKLYLFWGDKNFTKNSKSTYITYQRETCKM